MFQSKRYLNIANRVAIVLFCGFVYEYYFRDLTNLFSKLVSELSVLFHCFWLRKNILLSIQNKVLAVRAEQSCCRPCFALFFNINILLSIYKGFVLDQICGGHSVVFTRLLTNDRDMSSMHGPRFPMNRGRILLLNAISLNPPVLRRNIVFLLLLSSEEQRAKIRQVL